LSSEGSIDSSRADARSAVGSSAARSAERALGRRDQVGHQLVGPGPGDLGPLDQGLGVHPRGLDPVEQGGRVSQQPPGAAQQLGGSGQQRDDLLAAAFDERDEGAEVAGSG
jgi:hypothetical protein